MFFGNTKLIIRPVRLARTSLLACATVAAAMTLGVLCSRAGYAVPVPEKSLAGVKIFSHSDVVLKLYGTPDEVRIGSDSSPLLTDGSIQTSVNNASSQDNGPGAPPGYGAPGGGPGGPGGYGAPGSYGPPGGYGAPGSAGAPGSGSSAAAVVGSTATYVYDRPDGSSLEFTLSSSGRVIQIHLSGYKSPFKTTRGIGLGMSYVQVQEKYHYPDYQNVSGTVLNLNYVKNYHAAFQLLNQKVVGIIVAAAD